MYRLVPLVLLSLCLAPGCAAHRIQGLETELADRDTQLRTLQATNQGYLIELDTLRAQLDAVGRKNEELAAVYTALTNEFGPELSDGSASLVVYPDRTSIVIGDQLRFATGSARLGPDSDAALDKFAAFVKAHPDRRFQIEGHTDDAPIHNTSFASNWSLGAARALAVVQALIDRGVPEAQLSAATFAATEPIATNGHPDGMATNRRIALAVSTSVKESGAQQALLEAAQRAGGAVYAAAQPVRDGAVAQNDMQ